jgi:hypothetical protein
VPAGDSDHVGGLAGAHERARDDLIDRDLQGVERARLLAQSRDSLRRERTLGIVGIFLAALGGHSVTDQIKRECRHASVSLSAGG